MSKISGILASHNVDINGEFKVHTNSITTPNNIWFDPSISVAANVLQSSDVLGCLM